MEFANPRYFSFLGNIRLTIYAHPSNKSSRAWILSELGKSYYELGDLDKAKFYLQTSIELDRSVAGYVVLLSLVYRKQGLFSETVTLLTDASESNDADNKSWALSELCNLYTENGALDRAVDACKRAVMAKPYEWYLHLQLARVYTQAGSFHLAKEEYYTVLNLDANNRYATEELDRMLFQQIPH
jgi:tetratricopeptide (TPR) repeat protein